MLTLPLKIIFDFFMLRIKMVSKWVVSISFTENTEILSTHTGRIVFFDPSLNPQHTQ